MATAMEIQHLTYNIQEGAHIRHVLNDISYCFEEGVMYTISGPSGSGKTTLLYAMAGLLDDITGSIYINGADIAALKRRYKDLYRRDNIGMIFQNLNLFPFMSVEENILVPFYIRKMAVTKEIKSQIKSWLELLNLGSMQNKNLSALSGGEQQRVAIIRAMVMNPRLILCDEPTASLDSDNVIAFMEAMKEVHRRQNSTIVMVTHDPRVVSYGDVKLQMVDGRI
ncbi:MAG: ABC transporter ATP-binding protein [Lachnospiraceae bacterium]|nr:ABC transporter ATP-binding protein [Lachnospiraceae bacterium]